MIDMKLINIYIEGVARKKPSFLAVDDSTWEGALLGYQETLSEAVDGKTSTEEFWNLIFFSAIAFCKGIEFSEVQNGLRSESFYPRY